MYVIHRDMSNPAKICDWANSKEYQGELCREMVGWDEEWDPEQVNP